MTSKREPGAEVQSPNSDNVAGRSGAAPLKTLVVQSEGMVEYKRRAEEAKFHTVDDLIAALKESKRQANLTIDKSIQPAFTKITKLQKVDADKAGIFHDLKRTDFSFSETDKSRSFEAFLEDASDVFIEPVLEGLVKKTAVVKDRLQEGVDTIKTLVASFEGALDGFAAQKESLQGKAKAVEWSAADAQEKRKALSQLREKLIEIIKDAARLYFREVVNQQPLMPQVSGNKATPHTQFVADFGVVGVQHIARPEKTGKQGEAESKVVFKEEVFQEATIEQLIEKLSIVLGLVSKAKNKNAYKDQLSIADQVKKMIADSEQLTPYVSVNTSIVASLIRGTVETKEALKTLVSSIKERDAADDYVAIAAMTVISVQEQLARELKAIGEQVKMAEELVARRTKDVDAVLDVLARTLSHECDALEETLQTLKTSHATIMENEAFVQALSADAKEVASASICAGQITAARAEEKRIAEAVAAFDSAHEKFPKLVAAAKEKYKNKKYYGTSLEDAEKWSVAIRTRQADIKNYIQRKELEEKFARMQELERLLVSGADITTVTLAYRSVTAMGYTQCKKSGECEDDINSIKDALARVDGAKTQVERTFKEFEEAKRLFDEQAAKVADADYCQTLGEQALELQKSVEQQQKKRKNHPQGSDQITLEQQESKMKAVLTAKQAELTKLKAYEKFLTELDGFVNKFNDSITALRKRNSEADSKDQYLKEVKAAASREMETKLEEPSSPISEQKALETRLTKCQPVAHVWMDGASGDWEAIDAELEALDRSLKEGTKDFKMPVEKTENVPGEWKDTAELRPEAERAVGMLRESLAQLKRELLKARYTRTVNKADDLLALAKGKMTTLERAYSAVAEAANTSADLFARREAYAAEQKANGIHVRRMHEQQAADANWDKLTSAQLETKKAAFHRILEDTSAGLAVVEGSRRAIADKIQKVCEVKNVDSFFAEEGRSAEGKPSKLESVQMQAAEVAQNYTTLRREMLKNLSVIGEVLDSAIVEKTREEEKAKLHVAQQMACLLITAMANNVERLHSFVSGWGSYSKINKMSVPGSAAQAYAALREQQGLNELLEESKESDNGVEARALGPGMSDADKLKCLNALLDKVAKQASDRVDFRKNNWRYQMFGIRKNGSSEFIEILQMAQSKKLSAKQVEDVKAKLTGLGFTNLSTKHVDCPDALKFKDVKQLTNGCIIKI